MPLSTSLKPKMLLSGVRSSWLTVARKSLLSRFISYSFMLAWARSSSRSSSSLLTTPQLALLTQQLTQHAVEGRAELLEFVARANRRPLLDIALADRVGHVAQVRDRLDDHVPHHRPQREHRAKAHDNRRYPQSGPSGYPCVDCFLVINRHPHHGHQIANVQCVFGNAPNDLMAIDTRFTPHTSADSTGKRDDHSYRCSDG